MKKEDLRDFARHHFCVKVMNRRQEKIFIKICRKNGEPSARRGKEAFNTEGKPIFPIYYGFVIVEDNILSGWCSTSEEDVRKSGFGKVDLQTFKRW